ncbi:hypothetical protein PHYPSEUDO_001649 [Phytophthora pseudosyringae]|uniref:Uncharacterized protein n=1 Tax=Phytophthora pseudosyringae TaxID=221518 RepID=A0A8T1V4S9_9STRA|nr:hypothetical protein PHYPSEUDO_001649 [Phytophthora pseudosyringae]
MPTKTQTEKKSAPGRSNQSAPAHNGITAASSASNWESDNKPNATQNAAKSVSASRTMTGTRTTQPPTAVPTQRTTRSPQFPCTANIAPSNCSLRRMVRQNIPAAMQFFITVGQVIASSS